MICRPRASFQSARGRMRTDPRQYNLENSRKRKKKQKNNRERYLYRITINTHVARIILLLLLYGFRERISFVRTTGNDELLRHHHHARVQRRYTLFYIVPRPFLPRQVGGISLYIYICARVHTRAPPRTCAKFGL